ncbi:hypothetical protein LTR53_004421 [Teratosphaeriaceae sp. CCFEE 6253]|nr:hypothetical protein LTR53_004421 [Teratosphaeriaceae sp. CCFEE 6253]
MDGADDAALDALLAAREVEQCGHIRATPDDAEADLHRPASVDAAAPHDYDSEIDIPTPPPDPEEHRVEEAQARSELVSLGGFPCYPPEVTLPDVECPYREVPEEYREILSYWTLGGLRGYLKPLVAQVREWKEFLRDQVKIRAKYAPRPLGDLENAVRRRRRQFGMPGEVRLRSDPSQQTQLENIVEYQDFYFYHHLRLQGNLAREEKVLVSNPHDADVHQYRLRSCHRDIELQDILLRWLEQKRVELAALTPSIIAEDDSLGDDAADAAPTRADLRPLRKIRATLGKGGVSKPTQKRRSPRSTGRAVDLRQASHHVVDEQPILVTPVATPPQGVQNKRSMRRTAVAVGDHPGRKTSKAVRDGARRVQPQASQEKPLHQESGVLLPANLGKTRSGRVRKKPGG